MSDHERIDGLLKSHERKWSAAAAHHDEEAEDARDSRRKTRETHTNAPAEHAAAMDAVHDKAIKHHVGQAAAHRRRAEHARAGYLLDGPDERKDGAYQRDHAEIIGMAHRTGRVRHTEESCPCDE